MLRCLVCGEEYDRNGGLMVTVCEACLVKQPREVDVFPTRADVLYGVSGMRLIPIYVERPDEEDDGDGLF